MPWSVDDRVDVRAKAGMTWRPGTVRATTCAAHEDNCYVVELDTPIPADDWSGMTRRYGGSENVGGPGREVHVWQHTEPLVPNELIRTEGGA